MIFCNLTSLRSIQRTHVFTLLATFLILHTSWQLLLWNREVSRKSLFWFKPKQRADNSWHLISIKKSRITTIHNQHFDFSFLIFQLWVSNSNVENENFNHPVSNSKWNFLFFNFQLVSWSEYFAVQLLVSNSKVRR